MNAFLLTLGVGLVALSWYLRRREERWLASARHTVAQIVQVESDIPTREFGGRRKTFNVFPIVRFSDTSGRVHEQRSRTAILRSTINLHQTVDVLYDPAQPSDVRIGDDVERGLYRFIGAIGVVLLAFVIYRVVG
jgi:hypothetical protein